MARLVLGLGTRAVDRTGNDYPRLVALGAPHLRPEVTTEEMVRYSQRLVDVIDLEADRFKSVPLADLMAGGPDVPGLEMAASVCSEGSMMEPVGGLDGMQPERICLTFGRLFSRTPFASLLRDRLRRLEDAYEVPINVEFAQVGDEFYLLQCRPLVQMESGGTCRIPRDVPPDQQIFSARGVVRALCPGRRRSSWAWISASRSLSRAGQTRRPAVKQNPSSVAIIEQGRSTGKEAGPVLIRCAGHAWSSGDL